MISLQDLRRPLSARKHSDLWDTDKGRDAINALGDLIDEDGAEQTDAMAEALVYVLIHKMMKTRMLDRRRGAIPDFLGKVKKTVHSFDAKIR